MGEFTKASSNIDNAQRWEIMIKTERSKILRTSYLEEEPLSSLSREERKRHVLATSLVRELDVLICECGVQCIY